MERPCLEWRKEFKYLGVLFTSEGKQECEIDRRISVTSCYAVAAAVCRGEEGAKMKGLALNLLVDQCSHPHLWSRSLVSDQKNRIAHTRIAFLHKSDPAAQWAYHDGPGGEQVWVQQLLLCIKRGRLRSHREEIPGTLSCRIIWRKWWGPRKS